MASTAFMSSDKVNIFPSTRRTYSQEFSTRLLTESAIARLMNKFMSTDGFVISTEINDNHPFEFNIYGYYFSLSDFQQFLETSGYTQDVYASIFIEKIDPAFNEIYAVDESTAFKGLAFSSQTPVQPSDVGLSSNDYFVKTLKVATKQSNFWTIPVESKTIFTPAALNITNIDGGTI